MRYSFCNAKNAKKSQRDAKKLSDTLRILCETLRNLNNPSITSHSQDKR